MKTPLAFRLPDHDISFQMDLEGDCVADTSIAYCVNRWGMCEPEVCHVLARAIRRGDTVADIGANVGFFTLLMAQLVGPTGKVLAFEPAPQNLDKLDANITLNGFQAPKIIPVPLWSSITSRALWTEQDGGMATLGRAPTSISSIGVTTTTLEAEYHRGVPRVIKMDAEGAEMNILRGAGKLLRPASIPYVICEINEEALGRLKASGAEVREFMRQHGYDMFMLHQNGTLPTLVPRGTVLESTAQNLNVLFSTVFGVSEAWPTIQMVQNAA